MQPPPNDGPISELGSDRFATLWQRFFVDVANRLSAALVLSSVGAGPNAGTLTLVGGTATVATTAATATAILFFQRVTLGGTGGALTYTKVTGVSFTANSDNALDTSTYAWALMEPH